MYTLLFFFDNAELPFENLPRFLGDGLSLRWLIAPSNT